MLDITDLVKHFRGAGKTVPAVDGVSLTIAPGEFVAVQGPSGCGKSTLLLAAGGLLRPDAGAVRVAGQDPYALSPGQRAAFRGAKIGFVFQQFHLVPYLTVLENVLAAGLAVGNTDGRPRAIELIERFGLADRAGHRPGQLSTGERQRTALARAMFNRPALILADEPTGNLDDVNGQIVLQHLSQFASDGGAVMLVTHDPRAAQVAKRTVHLKNGKIDEPLRHESLSGQR